MTRHASDMPVTPQPAAATLEMPTPGAAAAPTADVLAAIVAGTRRSVEVRRAQQPIAALDAIARERRPRGELFAQGLRAAATVARPFNVIAECKRRSPSRGVLRADYDPVAIAQAYAAASAAAISVLTEPTFFDGSLDHLRAVRDAVTVPLLRKDFIVDDYQLLEARAAGADAILLIVAALDDASLRALLRRAADHGFAALVEVHTAEELTRAQDAGATIIGVNSRNLKTLTVSHDTLFALATRMTPSAIAVAESGIRTRADLDALRDAGYHAFLVGERFMTDADPGAALTRLLHGVGDTGAGAGAGERA
jgi:indole-3-glycerol phosphate synthase